MKIPFELKARVTKALIKAKRSIERQAIKELKEYSSGKLTYKQMRRLRYPYARKHARPLLDPGIINVHLGRVRSRWTATFSNNRLYIGNRSHIYRRFLKRGTVKMFERNSIEAKVQESIARKKNEIIQKEIAKSL